MRLVSDSEALFIQGSTMNLQLVDLHSQTVRIIIRNIGGTTPWHSPWSNGPDYFLSKSGEQKVSFINRFYQIEKNIELDEEIFNVIHWKKNSFLVLSKKSVYKISVNTNFKN